MAGVWPGKQKQKLLSCSVGWGVTDVRWAGRDDDCIDSIEESRELRKFLDVTIARLWIFTCTS